MLRLLRTRTNNNASANSVPTHYFFGLGNPGPKYDHTRHNIGFDVVDTLASALCADSTKPSWKLGKHGYFTLFWYRGDSYSFCLIKPLTFINRSGLTFPYLKKIGIPIEQMVIVYDNLDLPLGKIRLKRDGSSGGHNGLASIIGAIGSEFDRIGIGIGRPQYQGQVDRYVLSVPPPEEKEHLSNAVQRLCRSYLDNPLEEFGQRMEYLHRRVI